MTTKKEKYIGSCCGNAFVILDCRRFKLGRKAKVQFAKKEIKRYQADSALFLDEAKQANAGVDIFEKDGSQSNMCGNGTLLLACLLGLRRGIFKARRSVVKVMDGGARPAMFMNYGFFSVRGYGRDGHAALVKVGEEPHVVFFVDNLNKFPLAKTAKSLRRKFRGGVNVDVVERLAKARYRIKIFERGVWDETKSCGTGSLSAFLAMDFLDLSPHLRRVEFCSAGGKHWVSRHGNTLKLETLKKYCRWRKIG